MGIQSAGFPSSPFHILHKCLSKPTTTTYCLFFMLGQQFRTSWEEQFFNYQWGPSPISFSLPGHYSDWLSVNSNPEDRLQQRGDSERKLRFHLQRYQLAEDVPRTETGTEVQPAPIFTKGYTIPDGKRRRYSAYRTRLFLLKYSQDIIRLRISLSLAKWSMTSLHNCLSTIYLLNI